MNTLYYCEDCGEERPEIKAIRKYCEKHLNEHSPQEKEPWEKEFFDFVQKHEMYQRGFPVAETQDFIQSLLDAERAELVKEVIEIVGFVDEDFLTTPDCEEYPAEWAINKDRQRILQALDKTNGL
jgi:hypothetical protein